MLTQTPPIMLRRSATRDPLAQLRRGDGGLLPARAGADHQQVVVVHRTVLPTAVVRRTRCGRRRAPRVRQRRGPRAPASAARLTVGDDSPRAATRLSTAGRRPGSTRVAPVVHSRTAQPVARTPSRSPTLRSCRPTSTDRLARPSPTPGPTPGRPPPPSAPRRARPARDGPAAPAGRRRAPSACDDPASWSPPCPALLGFHPRESLVLVAARRPDRPADRAHPARRPAAPLGAPSSSTSSPTRRRQRCCSTSRPGPRCSWSARGPARRPTSPHRPAGRRGGRRRWPDHGVEPCTARIWAEGTRPARPGPATTPCGCAGVAARPGRHRLVAAGRGGRRAGRARSTGASCERLRRAGRPGRRSAAASGCCVDRRTAARSTEPGPTRPGRTVLAVVDAAIADAAAGALVLDDRTGWSTLACGARRSTPVRDARAAALPGSGRGRRGAAVDGAGPRAARPGGGRARRAARGVRAAARRRRAGQRRARTGPSGPGPGTGSPGCCARRAEAGMRPARSARGSPATPAVGGRSRAGGDGAGARSRPAPGQTGLAAALREPPGVADHRG